MSLTVGMIPTAISAIQALLKYRDRVDQILAVKEASAELPFTLPPAPFQYIAVKESLFTFFHSDKGRLALELSNRTEDFKQFEANPASPENSALRHEFIKLFYLASDMAPVLLGPQSPPDVLINSEMRLSYYVVESHRLSRNPALTRILLVTADMLLETAAANASLFTSNPKTQAIVSTLLEEFAVKRDFDDESGELILKHLLRSAVVAAMENQESISDEPAILALFGALSDMRTEFDDDFVANIISRKGFQILVGKYIGKVAEDPSFLIKDGPFKVILSETLKDLGKNFTAILDDEKALFGVLEVALTSAAGQASEILSRQINGKSLLPTVLAAVLKDIEKRGEEDDLFKSVANGEIITGIFQASMGAIAANPTLLTSAGKINMLSASLVAGMADILSAKELSQVVSVKTLRDIASRSFVVLAKNSSAWAGNEEFVTKLVSGVLKAASSAVEDGLSKDDVANLMDVAIQTATRNLSLLKVDVQLQDLLEAVGVELSEQRVRDLLNPTMRAKVIVSAMEAVTINPKVWSRFAEKDMLQPLVAAVFKGLATDGTTLLSGPVMVEGLRLILKGAALRGQKLIDGDVSAEVLQELLTLGLSKVDEEIGRSIDGETLPQYLERLLHFFFEVPFELGDASSQEFQKIHEKAIAA